MAKKSDYVQGTCLEMCPFEEIEIREKEKLLHLLEVVPGTERSRFPRANRNFMVKSFSRSAAGKTVNKPEHLRPPKVLLKTVGYLLFDVIHNEALPWHMIYDFITDRLLAVRQDMVIQNVSSAESIAILQPIVRFHAYAAYKLCNEKSTNFDPVLNNRHLQECLKRLLSFYDTFDCYLSAQDESAESNSSYDYLIESRLEFEAMYITFNLGNEEALRRALTIPKKCKVKMVKEAFELSLCSTCNQFVRMCRLMEKLPFLLAAVASLFLPKIRRKAFRVMSTAYSSKNLKFPMASLKDILLYGSTTEFRQDITYYGIKADDQYIFFSRQDFDSAKAAVLPRQEAFVEVKYRKEDLHSILFNV